MTVTLEKLEIVQMPALRVVGKALRCKLHKPAENPIPAFWEQCFKDGTVQALSELPDRIHSNALIGWAGEFDPGYGEFSYLVAVLCQPGANAPAQCRGIDVPAGDYAVGTLSGTEPDIYMEAHRLVNEAMKAKNRRFDQSRGFEMEWYDERFDPAASVKIIDFLSPVVAEERT